MSRHRGTLNIVPFSDFICSDCTRRLFNPERATQLMQQRFYRLIYFKHHFEVLSPAKWKLRRICVRIHSMIMKKVTVDIKTSRIPFSSLQLLYPKCNTFLIAKSRKIDLTIKSDLWERRSSFRVIGSWLYHLLNLSPATKFVTAK